MWCASVVRVSFGSLRASSAILRCRVEMTSRPNVPAICPPASSILRAAASLRRVLWGEFPDLTGTISRLRLLAPRRASLRFLRSALPPLRPLRSPRAGRLPKGQDHFYRGARAASSRWRRRDIPGSWATLAYMPRSQTPADRRTQATTGPTMWSSADLMTSTPHRTLSRLSHAACTLSVYASQPGSPPDHATLDSGWWPTLTGQGSHLLGRIEGFRHVRSSTWLSPSPSFAWRNKSLFLRRSRRYPNTDADGRAPAFHTATGISTSSSRPRAGSGIGDRMRRKSTQKLMNRFRFQPLIGLESTDPQAGLTQRNPT